MTNNPDDTRMGHNAAVRADMIKDAFNQLVTLNAGKTEIADQIKKIKTQITDDLDMKISHFNLAYKLYQLESKERDSMLDTVRECFNSLGAGDQLDWVVASEANSGKGSSVKLPSDQAPSEKDVINELGPYLGAG